MSVQQAKSISILVLAVLACTLLSCLIASSTLTVVAASQADTYDIKSIQAGYFSLMLKNDGSVWAWGMNTYGELGDGTTTNQSRPTKVLIDDVKEISADGGADFAMALKKDGTVWVWGSNLQGQYGNGMISTSSGPSIPGQVPGLYDITGIAATACSCFAIKSDGTVWSWGSNALGVLGDGSTTMRSSPVQAKGLTDIVAVSSCGVHALALDRSGRAWAWGSDVCGELGNSSADQIDEHGFRFAPSSVLVPIDNVIAIETGDGYSMAIKNDGTLWAWGDNEFGELGDGPLFTSSTPVRVPGLEHVVEIESGGKMSMALKNDGTLWFWGLNTNLVNEVAFNGATTNNIFYTPIQYNLIDDVKAFSLGNGNILALKNDGTLWAWGSNWFGELGIGTFNNDLSDFNVVTPIKVLLDPSSPAVTVHDSWWDQAATIINMPDTTAFNLTNPLPVSTENSTATNPATNSTTLSSQGNHSDLELFGLFGLVAITGIIVWNKRNN